MTDQDLSKVLTFFKFDRNKFSFQPVHYGYINDTYLVQINNKTSYVLQRLNHNVFENIEYLQHNIDLALTRLHGPDYVKIEFIESVQNKNFAFIENNYWRLMTYINNSRTFNTTNHSKIAFEAGKILGTFHRLLENEDLNDYKISIPDFHHLPARLIQFNKALETASSSSKEVGKSSIQFAQATLHYFDAFYAANIPDRVCHNDTKLNNILFDPLDQALCFIDLDTLMKGYFHYDFGDAVRTIVNQAEEDEKDISKVNFDQSTFEAFIKGLNKSSLQLKDEEIDLLPIAVALMPFLHGLRALTDFLEGNKYYKISYPEQNLDRSKALFEFTRLALLNQSEITSLIQKELK